jgi:hypothetical protein
MRKRTTTIKRRQRMPPFPLPEKAEKCENVISKCEVAGEMLSNICIISQ